MKYRSTLLMSLALAGAGWAQTPDPVETELAGLVEEVVGVLKKQNQQQIRIGKFTGDGDIPSHFGPEIQRYLIALFSDKHKIRIDRDATIEIKGDYRPAKSDPANPNQTEMFIRINASLVDTNTGKPLANVAAFSRGAYGNEALARAFAVPVSLPPSADRNVRNEQIKRRIDKPETHVADTLIRSSAASPFAVEMLVVPNAKSPDPAKGREVKTPGGLAFVEIAKGEVYRVKIHNSADFDVAVKISVDGLDQFVFADKENFDEQGKLKFLPMMIVPKGKTAVVRGWFRTLKKADSFQVSSYAESAAVELNASQGEVGVVNVQFFAAWDTAEQLKVEGAKDATATKRGEPVDTDLKVVPKFIGAFRDQVSVRYTKK